MKLHRIIKDKEPKAEVIEFTSGIVAIGWLMEPFQVTIWTSLDHAIEAHSLDRTMAFEPWDNNGHSHKSTGIIQTAGVQKPGKVKRRSKERAGGLT